MVGGSVDAGKIWGKALGSLAAGRAAWPREHLEGCPQDSWMGAAAPFSEETDLWLLSSSKIKGLRNS